MTLCRDRAVLLAFTLLATSLIRCHSTGSGPYRPSLVVMITVDQLRADLLDRYDGLFTGGFRRLRDRGMRFKRAMVDHAVTVSHPGHVTLTTGLVPARHGIVDAAWHQPAAEGSPLIDAVEDSRERILGINDGPGASPRQILAKCLPEWFMQADSAARFVAVGSGEFSSLLHACHARGDVYWYTREVGRFVTSTYYRQHYPEWVNRFNRDTLPGFMSARVWANSVPVEARSLSRRDAAAYEADGTLTTFPHLFEDMIPEDEHDDPQSLFRWFAWTPMLDAATLALAQEAVRARSLGQRGSIDYLSVILSQSDDIGHWYGPLSQEQLDNLYRLDQELGDFFDSLDDLVGKERWMVALSGDHGAPNVPEYQQEIGAIGSRIRTEEIGTLLDAVRMLAGQDFESAQIRSERVAEFVERHAFVADVMTPAELIGLMPADALVMLFRNSYRPDRVPRFPLFSFSTGASALGEIGLAVRLIEGAIIDLNPVVHGSPYSYDRHVPLIFMGPGISPGASNEDAHTTDMAPTLAALAGIPFPEGLDGRPLLAYSNRSATTGSTLAARRAGR